MLESTEFRRKSGFAVAAMRQGFPSGAGFHLGRRLFQQSLHGLADVLVRNRGRKIGPHLAEHVLFAGFGEIGGDDLLGIGFRLVAALAELAGGPFAELAVAPGDRAELLLLVEDEFALEGVLAVVERGHATPPKDSVVKAMRYA